MVVLVVDEEVDVLGVVAVVVVVVVPEKVLIFSTQNSCINIKYHFKFDNIYNVKLPPNLNYLLELLKRRVR